MLAIFLPLYFLMLDRHDGDSAVIPARLLATPPLPGEHRGVGVAIGKLAPDFEISTPDGRRVRLSDLRGQAVLINFWAQWCTSCLSEMPEIKALQAQLGVERLAVLAVNAGESPGEAGEFIDFLGAPFVYGLDIDLTVADAYGVYGLPLSVFIDSAGVIQGVYVGHASRDRLEALVAAAIEARPAAAVAPVLRFVSTLPRERFLDAKELGGGKVEFASKSLRCDPSFCAQPALNVLAASPGIRGVASAASSTEPRVLVEFDAALISVEEVAGQLAGLLLNLNDPVYTGPLPIRYAAAR